MNEVNLLGFCGKEPEIKTTQDGREIALLSLATTESWKDKTTGEKKEITDWHKLVIYQPHLVSLCKSYIKKGSKLLVRGKVKTRSYDDKKSGEKRYITEIVLDFDGKITLLDSKENKPVASFHEKSEAKSFDEISAGMPDDDFPDDNIPF